MSIKRKKESDAPKDRMPFNSLYMNDIRNFSEILTAVLFVIQTVNTTYALQLILSSLIYIINAATLFMFSIGKNIDKAEKVRGWLLRLVLFMVFIVLVSPTAGVSERVRYLWLAEKTVLCACAVGVLILSYSLNNLLETEAEDFVRREMWSRVSRKKNRAQRRHKQ